MFLTVATPKVIFVTACFIAVPVGLFLLHLFLSFRKRAWLGFIAPIIWALLSIWIVAQTETYTAEMIIFCTGIDAILIAIWALCRYFKNKKENNANVKGI